MASGVSTLSSIITQNAKLLSNSKWKAKESKSWEIKLFKEIMTFQTLNLQMNKTDRNSSIIDENI